MTKKNTTKKTEITELPEHLKKTETLESVESETNKTVEPETVKLIDLNIYQRMAQVRGSVNYLKKADVGAQYSYTGSSSVISSVRDAMNIFGIILIPEIDEQIVKEGKNNKGNIMFFTKLNMVFHWVNIDLPKDRITVKWGGQGTDDFEKGIGKALTYAEKYLILKTFNIPTDKDDPDAFQQKTDTAQQQQFLNQQAPKQDSTQPPADKTVVLEIDLLEVERQIKELNQETFKMFLVSKNWLTADQNVSDLYPARVKTLGLNWDSMKTKYDEFHASLGD